MKKTDSIEFNEVNVTPAMASKWLKSNSESNRKIAWQRVESFVNDIRAGKWLLTHQPICFDKNGMLIDGQHRLTAVIQAGVAARMFVATNPKAQFNDPIDRGSPRTVAFLTGLHPRITSGLNVLRMLEFGQPQSSPMTVAEAEATYEHHKGPIDQIIQQVEYNYKLHGSVMAACVWAMPCDPLKVVDFAQKVVSGEMIRRGDAAYAFRSWKERNIRESTYKTSLAALSCIRYHLHDAKMNSVYIGEIGYRGITGRRRALSVPHTPGTNLVVGANFKPKPGEALTEKQ